MAVIPPPPPPADAPPPTIAIGQTKDQVTGGNPSGERIHMVKRGDSVASILRDPIIASDFQGKIGVSMGAAIFPEDSGDIESLLNNATLAMHRAKAEHIAGVCFYQRSMVPQSYIRQSRML